MELSAHPLVCKTGQHEVFGATATLSEVLTRGAVETRTQFRLLLHHVAPHALATDLVRHGAAKLKPVGLCTLMISPGEHSSKQAVSDHILQPSASRNSKFPECRYFRILITGNNLVHRSNEQQCSYRANEAKPNVSFVLVPYLSAVHTMVWMPQKHL